MFKVIAEHADFIVVDKSPGVNFHDEGNIGSGLHSLVKAHVLNKLSSQQQSIELFPVHRLDKMTSGLVIFAKNLACAQIFGKLFSEHKIEKYYLAVSDKKPTKKQGLIKGDMAKSRRGMFKLLRSMANPAITQFFSYSLTNEQPSNKQRLYLLRPHSGKTHQLRVALSSIGSPIMGDPLYYAQSQTDRGYLHAYAIKFIYLGASFEYICSPRCGEHFIEKCFTEQLTALKKPWQLNWPKL